MNDAAVTRYKSPLHEMTQTTPTCLWNDSASVQDLKYSIENGSGGATRNPVIVLGVRKNELPAWSVRFDASDIEVRSRIDEPVRGETEAEVARQFADFRRASTELDLSIEEFDSFGPTRRALRQSFSACHKLDGVVRDVLIPNPGIAELSDSRLSRFCFIIRLEARTWER
jgi:hypothetical protein